MQYAENVTTQCKINVYNTPIDNPNKSITDLKYLLNIKMQEHGH